MECKIYFREGLIEIDNDFFWEYAQFERQLFAPKVLQNFWHEN